MKKLNYLAIATLIILTSCSGTCEDKCKSDLTEFETNKETVMKMFNGFEAKNMDASIFADNFIEIGTGVDEPDRNKEEALDNWKGMMDMMNMSLKTSIFLPGVDTVNFQPDGSVRYYGTWEIEVGKHKASDELMVYGSFEFDKDGKMTSLQHYGDYTGTLSSINQLKELLEDAEEEGTLYEGVDGVFYIEAAD